MGGLDDERTAGADATRGVSRRGLLASSAAVLGAGLVAACGAEETPPRPAATAPSLDFHGDHQPGIVTPPPDHLHFLALDVATEDAGELRDLLQRWSQAAAELMAGTADGGAAAGLGSRGLTLTFGIGPSLFAHRGRDRLGLRSRRPDALADLPALPRDELDPRRSGGDLGIQACADDAQVAFNAVHVLLQLAHGVATPRWAQTGFSSRAHGATPRNLLGFKDGTSNLDVRRNGEQLWVSASDGHGWMAGGTYLVARRIVTLLDVWDATSVERQERTIGRRKESGAPLNGSRETDPVDLAAEDASGPVTPVDAHVRLAAPASNGGATMLRRGYNFSDGVDAATGQLEAGLFFISFQRDPRRQLVPVMRRLSQHDALDEHIVHRASAVFACPPGATRGGFVGERLFV